MPVVLFVLFVVVVTDSEEVLLGSFTSCFQNVGTELPPDLVDNGDEPTGDILFLEPEVILSISKVGGGGREIGAVTNGKYQ